MAVTKAYDLSIKDINNMDIGLGIIMNEKLPLTPSWRFGQWKEDTEKIAKAAQKKRDEIIKELGEKTEDGGIAVKPENKQEYFDQYKALLAETSTINVPEIPVNLIKDIPLDIRFTTLVGQYLKNDNKWTTKASEDATNQQYLDADLGLSLIMVDKLPTQLALKLGECKRLCEAVSTKVREFRENLLKKLGTLNEDYDYEIKDEAKKKEFDDTLQPLLDAKPDPAIEMPVFLLSEFNTSVTVDGNKTHLTFPARFFTLFATFIEEDSDSQEEEKKDIKSKRG